MIERERLTAYLNDLLQVDVFDDYGPNGLQVEGRARIARVVSGVTASLALIERAIALRADALLVHHGWFWRGEDPRIVGQKQRRLAALLGAGINLYAYHLPLDQVWAFVAPGLYQHEKRLVIPLIFMSTVLFYLGVAFAYFIVLGRLFTFIQDVAPKVITAAPDIESYLSFVLTLFLAFGAAFEVPVVLMLLVRFGVLTIDQLKKWRSYFVVVAFIIAAVITPPDVFSQTSLAVSMILLYEVGIVGARLLGRYAAAPDDDVGERPSRTDGGDKAQG